MPTVSTLNVEDFVEEKRETTGALTIITTETFSTAFGTKPTTIVKPQLRRREPSVDDDTDKSTNLRDLESQIFDKLANQKQKQSHEIPKDLENKLNRFSISRGTDYSRDSKKSSRDGSTPDIIKRPLFVTTVPRNIFLPPQPVVREIIVKPRHIYAYASRPRILDPQQRRQILATQLSNSSNNSQNHTYNRGNIIHKNINSFDNSTAIDHVDARSLLDTIGDVACRVAGVKITRTRDNLPCQNLMYDRRVVRGSNFASNTLQVWNPYFANAGLLSGKGDGDCVKKEDEAKRRQLLRKRQVTRNQRGVIGTPPAVRGRKHETIQTEKYLEELFARPPELEQSCQTDLFLQRPPTPPYVQSKVGVDVSTEILDGDLFDFDSEVQPILEVLVGRTLQQALTEVMHEEEIADLREQQQNMLAIREAEMAELRRMEEQEKRLQGEKDRRIAEDVVIKDLNCEMMERVTAAKLIIGHIASLLPSVLESIESVREAENREELTLKLTPWLAEEVATEIGQMVDSRELLLEIVKEVLQHRAEIYSKFDEDDSLTDSPTKDL